jgi:hypothetical protein
MERLNAFIVSNKPALGRFYDQIVDHPERGKLSDLTVRQHKPTLSHFNSPQLRRIQVPTRARNDALIKLRSFLGTNLGKVEAALKAEGEEEAEEVIVELRRLLRKDSGDQV